MDEVQLDALSGASKEENASPPSKEISQETKTFTLKIGDQVRTMHLQRTFQQDCDQTYTEEVFVVHDRFVLQGIPIYRLKDMMADPIKGTFYISELQKVSKGKEVNWLVGYLRFYVPLKNISLTWRRHHCR
jgi:hypothetical protein